MGKFSLVGYTYFTIIACLLGVNFFSLNLGLFQLSPYRFLVLVSIFIIPNLFRVCVKQIKQGNNFHYIFFLFFWIIYSLFPVFWVKDYVSWAKALSFLITGLFSTLLVFGVLNCKERIVRAIEIITLVSFLYSFLAFYEMLTGNYLFVTDGNLEYYQEFSLLQSATGFREPVTVFGNPNDYSLFLFFTFVFAFLLFKIKINRFAKCYYLTILIISIFLIICTQSRAGFIGCVFFFLTYVVLTFIRNSFIFKLKASIFILLVSVLLVYTFREDFGFFRDVATIELAESNQGSSDDIRKNLIKNGLEFLNNTYFLGVGLGNIEYHMFYYPKFNTGETTNIHNWWMEILVSSGIFVFGYFLLTYTVSMYNLYIMTRRSKLLEAKNIYAVFFCFFVGFIIASVGSSSLVDSEWYWPLMAICMKVSTIDIFKMSKT